MEDLDKLLGGSFEEFSALNTFERTSFVLGCENWERYDFKALLNNGETSGCFCSCPLIGDLASSACVCGCVVNGVSATAAT